MNFSSIIEKVASIEQSFDVNLWRVGRLPVWPVIRIKLYLALRDAALDCFHNAAKCRESYPRTLGKRILKKIQGTLENFNQSPHIRNWLRPCDCVFLSYTHYREKLDGFFYDRHCDPLVEYLNSMGWTTRLMDIAESKPYQRLVGHHQVHIQELLLHRKFARATNLHQSDMLASRLDGYDVFLQALAKDLSAEQLAPFAAVEIVEQIQHINRKSAIFGCSLDILRPKLAFVTCYYGMNSLAFVLAARIRNIPVVDIQHGMQYHPGYLEWNKVPLEGYPFLPDFFWLWDSWGSERLSRWADGSPGRPKVLVGGYQWIRFAGQPAAVTDEDKKYTKLNNKKTILLSLPTYPVAIPDWLVQVVDETAESCKWRFRAHPRMDDQMAMLNRSFGDKNAPIEEVTATSRGRLLDVLSRTDVHVTWESTVIQEAVPFGIPSLAIEPDALAIFPKASGQDYLRHAGDRDTMLKELASDWARKRPLHNEFTQKKSEEEKFTIAMKSLQPILEGASLRFSVS